MINVCCRFDHSFKIMCIPHPVIPEVVPTRPVQALRAGRGGEIDVMYTSCIEGWEPEIFELWVCAEDRNREVHPYDKTGNLTTSWTENTFVYGWGTNPTVIPHRIIRWGVHMILKE